MPNKPTPLKQVQDQFGDKQQLVDKLVSALDRGDESEDDLKSRLRHVPNRKLLRLLAVTEKVAALGGRDALIAEIAKLRGHSGDKDFAAKLAGQSPASLLDQHASLSRRAKKN
ncbi:MAG: hypothetical protein B7733_14340 [Myxococcales bacterium FL481]|nr:MAG: hypothetical protein B7733_14340 [Myxococcales bacterium FL481]